MKLLNGAEIASFIKERQLHASRSLRQSLGVKPKLAIVRTNPDQVVDVYMRLKQSYGHDIEVDVEVFDIDQAEALHTIDQLNHDPGVHGIVVQLPLPDPSGTREIVNRVHVNKDVDGLGENAQFDAATPTAINWLLNGYNIDLVGKEIVVVGQGALVGAPLTKMWRNSGLAVQTADDSTEDLRAMTKSADIIVTATGVPRLITKEMVKPGVVIVDAGVATDKNGFAGDVDQGVRQIEDITITPEKGGVGPLTVAALFENVLTAARNQAQDN